MNLVPQLLAIFEGEGGYFRCVFEGGDWSLGLLSATCSQHHDAQAYAVEQLEACPRLRHSQLLWSQPGESDNKAPYETS